MQKLTATYLDIFNSQPKKVHFVFVNFTEPIIILKNYDRFDKNLQKQNGFFLDREIRNGHQWGAHHAYIELA